MKKIQLMNLRIFSLLFLLVLPAQAERESLVSEEVYLRINKCILDYYLPFVKSSNDSQAKTIREKAFAGLDDREKIRALAEWMFRKPLPQYNSIPSQAKKLLIAKEPVIQDYSELRRLMATETDSRRFYQLSTLSYTAEKYGYDFMVDCAKGLFMEGVAADRGQSTTDHPLQSISMNTFSRITQRLRDESQVYKEEVHPELVKLDLEARNLALAKWLKTNWPGCENLEIPDNSDSEKDPVGNTSIDTRVKLRKPPVTDPPLNVAESYALRYLLGGVGTLVVLVGAWFGLRRMKSRL